MISYYDIADIKIRYESMDEVTDKAALTFAVPPFSDDQIDLKIIEQRYGRLKIPENFQMTYEQQDELNCFASPEGELIIQLGLNRGDDRRDGSYRARISSDMSFAEVDYTPYLSNDAISGNLGRFLFECSIMNRGWLAMHAVSVDIGGGAILFSGVSGAGKSTQGDLWLTHHTPSRIINGDRVILIPENNGFKTKGTAWSGTSEIYTKLSAPVKAIIFIEQAKVNEIERLTPQRAFEHVAKHCAVPYYHSGLMRKVFDSFDHLTSSVPVYFLRNKADEECYKITEDAVL